jgi:hypothetical protein
MVFPEAGQLLAKFDSFEIYVTLALVLFSSGGRAYDQQGPQFANF